jgi:Prenyltransferase and squalene oxidase repeat
MRIGILAALVCLSLVVGFPRAEEKAPTPDPLRAAVAKSLPLLEKGAAGHRDQRTCFACHNQGLPILALTTAKHRGFEVSDAELKKHTDFIADFLGKNRAGYLKGKGQGGQADTAGYAVWTLERLDYKADETTAAVAEYLLQHQKELDHWRTGANRPPSEVGPFTTTYLAIRGLRQWGTAEQKERIDARIEQVRDWLLKAPAKTTEDRIFRFWSLKLAGAKEEEVRQAAGDLVKTQREDGGWSQLDSMSPDAYATGSALVALQEAGGMATSDAVYQAGLRYLLKTQLEDGSWHVKTRSRPFQTYFETGFPHGKDQFISSAASGWATTALALACPAK